MPENRLIMPVHPPLAWNIGPALSHEEEAHAVALANEANRVTAHVFGPRSDEVRYELGSLAPVVLIYGPKGLVASLSVEQIAMIVKHWRRLGVELPAEEGVWLPPL